MAGYDRVTMTQYMIRYREKRRQQARAQLGGKCKVCGTTENLEFDHIDPRTRLLPIGKMWHASKAALAAELAKCQLLCKKHHVDKSRAEGSFFNEAHIHRPTRPPQVVTFQCAFCGAVGEKPKWRIRSKNLFCDRQCYGRYRREAGDSP